ncbi:hypothetical protein KNE206_42150 [Kitasatospora sp. NE20-6]|uniref:tetratricopeptide repeat protein n=1 Tax=Kitasatospora sp. NE20-6 TaxID=2859066 RepID=UPI0034DCAAAB
MFHSRKPNGLGAHEKACMCFHNAVQCPGRIGNPYIHLRLGRIAFESGDHDQAAEEMVRACMGGGPGMFTEDDTKYLEFMKTRADLDQIIESNF